MINDIKDTINSQIVTEKKNLSETRISTSTRLLIYSGSHVGTSSQAIRAWHDHDSRTIWRSRSMITK